MGHITLEEYYSNICHFFQSLNNQYSKTIDYGAIHLHLGPPLRPSSHSNLLEISKLLLLRLPSPAITGNQSTGIQQLLGLPNLEDQLLISSNCATIGGQPQQAGQVGGWH